VARPDVWNARSLGLGSKTLVSALLSLCLCSEKMKE
jgi:hypothetical protein